MITQAEYKVLLEKIPEYRDSDGILQYDYSCMFHYFANDDIFKVKVLEICKIENIQQVRKAMMILAQFIFWEESRSRSGEKINFKPTSMQKFFQKYMYRQHRLERKRVPFEKWSDLAQANLDLLKTLLEEGNLEKIETDPRYLENSKKYFERHEELRLSGDYDDLNEVMDD